MSLLRVGRIRPQVIKALSQTSDVRRQMRTTAQEVRKLARQKAPRKSGKLRRSLRYESVFDKGMVTFRVGWDPSVAFWGPLVELGTEDTAAQPHLRPAADEINNRR